MNGGAVDWYRGAMNGFIINSTFENNTANRSGGAVFWFGTNGTIKDSTFTNNNALGLVLHNDSYGNLTSGGHGGAIRWTGPNGYVDNCTFINNEAHYNEATNFGGRGGAIYLQGSDEGNCINTTFSNCKFIGNIAGTNGGAIDWHEGAHDGNIINSTFINNTARRNGGAIFWNGYNGTIKNSRFENNRATGESWEYTFDLDMGTTITVEDDGTLILGNIKVIQDDALPTLTPTPSDEKILFVLNYTNGTHNKFESYVAHNNGSGLIWLKLDETSIEISDSVISPVDWAIDQYYGGDGGSILWSGDLGDIYNCTFTDSNSARRGGGAYMTGGNYITYELCNFTDCTSGTNGGGVDWLAGANYGKIYNCVFNNTRAARSAGAIYYDGWYGDMENITIIGTKSWGGSLDNSSDGRVKYAGWDSSHWDTNTTGGDAGAIMYTGSNIKVYNVTFTNCVATGRGGAVFLQYNRNVTFDLCVFKNNQALGIANNTWNDDKNLSSGKNPFLSGNGGAIGFDTGATLGIIKNSKFINNTAQRLGGAISFAKGSSYATIYNATFVNNTARRNGGAISVDGIYANMSYCYFTNNSALGTDVDRSIFDLKTLSQIKQVTTTKEVVDESVLPDAGPETLGDLYAIVQYRGTTKISYTMALTIQDSNGYHWTLIKTTNETSPSPLDWIVDEYLSGDGGSIFWRGDNGIVDYCNFVDSNSARRGGGAYMTGSDNITFSNSNFTNCTSGTNGGGLDWLAGANYGNVINCIFNNTRAARSAKH